MDANAEELAAVFRRCARVGVLEKQLREVIERHLIDREEVAFEEVAYQLPFPQPRYKSRRDPLGKGATYFDPCCFREPVKIKFPMAAHKQSS